MKKSYEMDMCSGPLLSKILVFSIPLMLSGILQLLFNAADIIVVGRFTGSEALAAVGSTSALINLIINLFIGISVGANVVVARFYGARDVDGVHEAVHTSILTAIIGGIILIFVGVLLAKPLLELMGTPEDVIDLSVLYMRIYFVGMPAFMLYNFGAAILRAIGDTKRPLYFLTLSGVVNVVLNLFLLLCSRWVLPVLHCNHYFPGNICSADCAVSDQDGGTMSSGLKTSSVSRQNTGSYAPHRFASRTSGCSIQHLQRVDSVFGQLLWFSGYGGKYCSKQHRGLCIHCNERSIPDLSELYQPEYGCKTV